MATNRIIDGLLDNSLIVMAVDPLGSGGANSHYTIGGMDLQNNPAAGDGYDGSFEELNIFFQNGPIPEVGVNGATLESLLLICADRLRSFQAGLFPNHFNAAALQNVESAMACLNARTEDRRRRDVEGKLEP